jgi:phosphoglycerol transferase MdoB-like AlkP superfamily enzyme
VKFILSFRFDSGNGEWFALDVRNFVQRLILYIHKDSFPIIMLTIINFAKGLKHTFCGIQTFLRPST